MKRIRVMAIPATENKADNPYNYILYSAMKTLGVEVMPASLQQLLKATSFDIVHFHWPENFLAGKKKATALIAFASFALKIAYLKLRGKTLVWTIHNKAPHEMQSQRLYTMFYQLLYAAFDGFISLTNAGAEEVATERKIPCRKIAVIPHPQYAGHYPNLLQKNIARDLLHLSASSFVFLSIGQVRPYKNVVGLVQAFRQLPNKSAVLVIAGKVHEAVAHDLQLAIADDERIRLHPFFISDEDLQVYLNAADFVVNPFQQIFNSGSVFLNLSFARPTLVPATPSLLELQQMVGEAWIKTFTPPLNHLHLQQCIEDSNAFVAGSSPNLAPFDPYLVAQQTKDFYDCLLRGREKRIEELSRGSLLKAMML